MENNEEQIELDLSGLDTSSFWNRGVMDMFFEFVLKDIEVSENEVMSIVGTKIQFERFYQLLKKVEYSRDMGINF